MDLALFTVSLLMVVRLEDVGISEPVFEVGAASESNDDSLEIMVESNHAEDLIGNDHLPYFKARVAFRTSLFG